MTAKPTAAKSRQVPIGRPRETHQCHDSQYEGHRADVTVPAYGHPPPLPEGAIVISHILF